MFKPKLSQPEQGFSLVEVLVAIIITVLFVSTAMQAMAIAAVFKARAQEFSEATTWIQEDLENLRYQASSYQYTSLNTAAVAGATSIAVASDSSITTALASDFAVTNNLKVGSDTGTYAIGALVPASGTTTLTISPGLGTDRGSGASVVATTRCKTSILTAAAAAGVSAITVASVGNFVVGDQLIVGSATGPYTISAITGTTLNLGLSTLSSSQSSGAVVVVTAATKNTGFADGLRDWVTDLNHNDLVGITNETTDATPVTTTKTSNRTTKQFTMTRTLTLSNTAPYNVLEVNYTVVPASGGSSIATFYTEVTPNAALQCPR